MRFLLALVLAAIVACAGVFIYAGHMPGPSIEIAKPAKYVGVSTPVEVHVTAPQGNLTRLDVAFEQNGKQTPLFALDKAAADKNATLKVSPNATPVGPVVLATTMGGTPYPISKAALAASS